jgi:F-type H+-transporting ATPase subunit epsilon
MLKLRIVTIEKVVVDETVSELNVTTPEGALGILPGHIALLTVIAPGIVRYRSHGKEYKLVSTSGSLEVKDNVATLLAEEVLPVSAIDVARAEAERARLLNVLSSGDLPLMELKEKRKELANVVARITAGQK